MAAKLAGCEVSFPGMTAGWAFALSVVLHLLAAICVGTAVCRSAQRDKKERTKIEPLDLARVELSFAEREDEAAEVMRQESASASPRDSRQAAPTPPDENAVRDEPAVLGAPAWTGPLPPAGTVPLPERVIGTPEVPDAPLQTVTAAAEPVSSSAAAPYRAKVESLTTNINFIVRYPRSARERNQEGTVILLMRIDAGGKDVLDVKLDVPSRIEAFNREALRAAEKLRTRTRDAAASAAGVLVRVPVMFKLTR